MADHEFPDEFNLRFRIHALFVHLHATLDFAAEIATEAPNHLSPEDLKLFSEFADQLERGWMKAAKIKIRALGAV